MFSAQARYQALLRQTRVNLPKHCLPAVCFRETERFQGRIAIAEQNWLVGGQSSVVSCQKLYDFELEPAIPLQNKVPTGEPFCSRGKFKAD